MTRTAPERRAPRSRRARLLATATGAALVLSALPALATAPAVADTAVPSAGLLAEYLFDETSGTTVPNSASGGVGSATVVNGADSHWTGSSLVFTGGAKTGTGNWVRLPDNLLSGKTSATVSIETKIDPTMLNNWHFLWNIGSDSTSQYYFASVRDAPRTAITTSGGNGEANARGGAPLTANRWYNLTSVIDGAAGTISFYIDGARVASTNTALTPASITSQIVNTIGRAPYPDPLYKGEVSAFRVYDRALSATEVATVSDSDAAIHAGTHQAAAQAVLDSVAEVTIDDSVMTLPNYGGAVAWSSDTPALTVSEDGRTVAAQQPAAGEAPVTTELTATATVRGNSVSRTVPVTIRPAAGADDPYGYAMVHFIENSAGYAEKIYLDVSRGNNPEQWDPLNGGQPILASHLGTTGVRDPYLTYNPENETYYIIATDLRVFGGARGSAGCTEWCYWSSQGSTKLNVWESKDLVTWSDLRQFDVALSDGVEVGEFGMAWAPEATWVDDYYEDGSGAFVVYWSSNVYDNPGHTGSTYSRILWGATPDFTQETYEYGGVFIDEGGNTIDTTITQHDGKTYRITKDNSAGKGIYLESTSAVEWWQPEATWTQIQTRIGAVWSGGNAGGVEGPAVFQRHGEDRWYLYVDVIPTTGYRPMVTTDLDAGFTQLSSPDFYMAPSTKHGGIIPLDRSQYDTIRASDATSAVSSELGSVEVPAGASEDEVRAALPATAEVNLAYNRGTSTLPVDWDVSTVVESGAPGTFEVTGTVRSIGANLNQWVGDGGSTAYNAPNRVPYSSTAIEVTAEVVVQAPVLPVTVVTDTRCVAGKVVLAVKTTNDGDAPVALGISTPYGSKSVAAVQAGKSTSAAFTTRLTSIPEGSVTVSVSAGGDTAETSAAVVAASCG